MRDPVDRWLSAYADKCMETRSRALHRALHLDKLNCSSFHSRGYFTSESCNRRNKLTGRMLNWVSAARGL